MEDHPPTDELEHDLSTVARDLYAAGTVARVLQRTVDLAVTTIDGCDAAGIFMVEDERVATTAASHPIAVELDELQSTIGEGPCLEAIAHGRTIHAPDLSDDSRWPSFGPAASRAGIRSVLALRLTDDPPAALNLYGHLPTSFGATDRAQGLIFATLAGMALGAAGERADKDDQIANLHEALGSRQLIGQATGILIERERITADQAFALLRRASQNLNIKIRDVAHTIVETGEAPPSTPRPPTA